jgi:NAD-dependent SIR2 family protein deacetylase
MSYTPIRETEPRLAWGFYGHRLNLYRATKPHEGFQILLKWAAQKSCGHFVFTSNVDGQFQRAGFDADRVVECHGSINHLQCLSGCHEGIWPVDQHVDVDSDSMTAIGAMPACRKCGGLARPNILMFGDGSWLESRTAGQMHRYDQWLGKVNLDEMAIIEIGAGNAIPTVRFNSERLASKGATLIRINPDDPQGPRGTIQLRTSALEALSRIDARLHLD